MAEKNTIEFVIRTSELLSEVPSTSQNNNQSDQTETQSIEISLQVSSTSENSSQESLLIPDADESDEIKKRVKLLIHECFENKEEMAMNLWILEEMVSTIIDQFPSTSITNKYLEEVMHLKQECKALRNEATELKRKVNALKNLLEPSKPLNKFIIVNNSRICPPFQANISKEVRSVGLQACTIGLPMQLCKSLITDNIAIRNELFAEEPRTKVKRKIAVKKITKSYTSNVNQTQFVSCRQHSKNKSGGKKNAEKDYNVKLNSPVQNKFIKEFKRSPKNVKPCRKRVGINNNDFYYTTTASKKTKYEKKQTDKDRRVNKSYITTRSMSKRCASGAPLKKTINSVNNFNIITRSMSMGKSEMKNIDNVKPKLTAKLNFETHAPSASKQEEHVGTVIKKKKNDKISRISKSYISTRNMSKKCASDSPLKKTIKSVNNFNIVTRSMSMRKSEMKNIDNVKPNLTAKLNFETHAATESEQEELVDLVIKKKKADKISRISKSYIITRSMSKKFENYFKITTRSMSKSKSELKKNEYVKTKSRAKVKSIKKLMKDNKSFEEKKESKNFEKHTHIASKQGNASLYDDDVPFIIPKPGSLVIIDLSYEELKKHNFDIEEDIKSGEKTESDIQTDMNYDAQNNFCNSSNEGSSAQGLRACIKSPELTNAQHIKSFGTVEVKNTLYQVPKYPQSPHYAPNVCRPPIPILLVKENNRFKKYCHQLAWNFVCKPPENILMYQLFFYQEGSGGNTSNNVWKKVGNIKPLKLPMAVTLSNIVENKTYYFIIRAVDREQVFGEFSDPAVIGNHKVVPSVNTPLIKQAINVGMNTIEEKNDEGDNNVIVISDEDL